MRLGLALVLLLTLPALAQELRWQLPDRGGATYKRTFLLESKVEPNGAWTPEVWSGERQPGTLLVGEFDAGRQRRAAAVSDLRELLPQVALDLTVPRAGKSRLEIFPANRFQPVRGEVTYGAIAADGQQTFSASLELDVKVARAAGTPPHLPRLTASLQGTRTLDRTKGLVTQFTGTADLTFEFPPHQEGDRSHPARRQTVHISDTWAEPVVMSAEDPEFKTRVANAIRSSSAHLKVRLVERLKTPFTDGGDPYHDHQPGELALILLALRRAGEDPRDPALVQGFDRLRKRLIEGTYELAVAILAVESLHTPPGEWAEMRAGRIKTPMPRQLPAEDLELVRGWARSLLDNIDTSVDAAYLRRWHYGPSKGWDNSNTQYALLGLYGAQLCGIEVSPQVWTAAGNHWLQCSVLAGGAEFPEITYHKDLEKGTRTRPGMTRLQPRGWGYGASDPTGSMTAAGITGLTLCSSGLRMQKKGNPKLLLEMDDAVRAGFLWFQHELSVRRNPSGNPDAWGAWHLYYLYGLERACELNQVGLIGGRDWYYEGAAQLLATQHEDGSWGDENSTAFGLLFLKKAALPAITGR